SAATAAAAAIAPSRARRAEPAAALRSGIPDCVITRGPIEGRVDGDPARRAGAPARARRRARRIRAPAGGARGGRLRGAGRGRRLALPAGRRRGARRGGAGPGERPGLLELAGLPRLPPRPLRRVAPLLPPHDDPGRYARGRARELRRRRAARPGARVAALAPR